LVLKNQFHFKELITLPEFAKVLWLQPRLAFVFIGSLFSIAGIPPFGGSVMKFLVISLFALHQNYFLMIVAFFLSILSLILYIRFIRLIIFYMPNEVSFLENNTFVPEGFLIIIYLSFFFNLFFLLFFASLDKYLFDLLLIFIRFYSIYFDYLI
jgi:NADH-quinone oxidoreductase subunit N